MLNCCLLIQTAYFMKLKQKMSMKTKTFYQDQNLFEFSGYLLHSKFFDSVNQSCWQNER